MSEDERDRSDAVAAETASLVESLIGPATDASLVLRDDVDLDAREIFLNGEIEDESGGWFLKLMRVFARRDPKAPVTVWIDSPGGDVASEFAIHDAIRTAPFRVTTVGIGEVASAAGLILACGHRRLVTESTVFMAHEPRVTTESELGLRAAKDRREWEDWQHEHWATLMARYAKGGKSTWRARVEKGGEYWLMGGQAIVDEGIADAVMLNESSLRISV